MYKYKWYLFRVHVFVISGVPKGSVVGPLLSILRTSTTVKLVFVTVYIKADHM